MKIKEIILISSVILIGAGIAFYILSMDKVSTDNHGHEEGRGDNHDEDHSNKGHHGGRILSKGSFKLEITIYERGVPPKLRVYAYEKDKIIQPDGIKLTIQLKRLGGRVDTINFKKIGDYLLGDKVVEEPHSFDVKVIAERGDEKYQWAYSQYEGRLTMSKDALRSSGIVIKTAGPAQLKSIIELPGQVKLDPDSISHVVPRVKGVAISVMKSLGDRVDQGEVLAVIRSRRLAEVRSDYIAWYKRLELAQKIFRREKSLWKQGISAKQDYLNSKQVLIEAQINLQKAKQGLLSLGYPRGDIDLYSIGEGYNLTRYEIRAPLSGTIIKKHITTGEAIKEDSPIFVIADLSTVWVEARVSSNDLNKVRLRQKAIVRSKSLGRSINGRLSYLSPLVNEATRTIVVRIVIPNYRKQWRPGLYVTVELIQEEKKVPVAISAKAIQTYRNWKVVFVKYGDQFEIRPLKLGRRDKEKVEVIEGLSSGEKYAEKNSFVLKAELGKSGATHGH